MPFPKDLEALELAGYKWLKMDVCAECGVSLEVFSTPGKREMKFDVMVLLTSPATPHYQSCNPEAPQSRDALEKNGWKFEGRITCGHCLKAVERWTSPKGDSHTVQCMMEGNWPVVEHGPLCGKSGAISHRAKDEAGHAGPSKPSPEPQQSQEGGNAGQEQAFKMYGVNDPNGQLIAVGYDAVSGILRCQFKTALWSYATVPEDVYMKLRSARYAYRQFTLTVKSKFPATKVA
jgi:hypothetical protein